MNKHDHLKEARRNLERAEYVRSAINAARNVGHHNVVMELYSEAVMWSSLATAHFLAATNPEDNGG